ncbi:MAG TPA: hypothetical protein VMH01_02675 [Puia sp.]|nr:hypothetical protein [Puia sp.]
MLHAATERKYIDNRIDHDSFAGPGTKGFVSFEERPMQIAVPDNLWPANLKPSVQKIKDLAPGSKIEGPVGESVDVLIMTYTTDEARALSLVFTGDLRFEDKWYRYGHNFSKIKSKITSGLTLKGKPTTLGQGTMAFIQPVKVGNKSAMLCKSELHPARNGKQLPFLDMVQQLIEDLNPKLVITAGTAGAVGTELNIGDVVVTSDAVFLCKHQYPDDTQINKLSANKTPLKSGNDVNKQYINYANDKFAGLIKPGLVDDVQKIKDKYKLTYIKTNGSPKIYTGKVPDAKAMNVISADYFSIDNSKDTEGLQELGIMNDMDDAFVAFAISQMNGPKPEWLSIRNASEPEIKYSSSEKKMKDDAGNIYDTCGFHTSYNSSFAAWGVVAGMN